MNVLGKTQKMKRHLQDQGLTFPASVDQGAIINRQSKSYLFYYFHASSSLDNVFRARLILKVVFQAVRANDLVGAEEALGQMMTLLALTKIRQPLVELDLVAHLISNNIKVTRPTTFNLHTLSVFFRFSSCSLGPLPGEKLSYGQTWLRSTTCSPLSWGNGCSRSRTAFRDITLKG